MLHSSGPNLDKNRAHPLEPALFYEKYVKFYFDVKRL